MVVSRTWHVIGGFLSVDIVAVESWVESAERRSEAREGIDLWSWERAWALAVYVGAICVRALFVKLWELWS